MNKSSFVCLAVGMDLADKKHFVNEPNSNGLERMPAKNFGRFHSLKAFSITVAGFSFSKCAPKTDTSHPLVAFFRGVVIRNCFLLTLFVMTAT